MADLTRDQVQQRLKRGEKMERADLRGLDLSKAQLAGAVLARSDLGGTNLEGANLQKAVLRNAILREAFLAGADLSGAVLENADLEGAKLDRANLAGANLVRANLEGASLQGAILTGACLSFAQLTAADLTRADLRGAVITSADLDQARLGGVAAGGTNFSGANMEGASLDESDCEGATFTDANMSGLRALGAKMSGASLLRVDLSGAMLGKADLTEVDLRMANLSGAVLADARLTGAKVGGMVGTGAAVTSVVADWVDASLSGDGKMRLPKEQLSALLSGLPAAASPPQAARSGLHRYFGKGDSLKNAALEFKPGANVEIDGFFQNCSIRLGEGTALVLGKEGVLADCKISGAGKITIHGKFFEGESPGIVGSRELTVTGGGALVAAIEQGETPTRFAFQKGCQLRVKIIEGSSKLEEEGGRQPSSETSKVVTGGQQTLVYEGTEVSGKIASSWPIVVMGKVEGEISGPSMVVAESGVVAGKIKVAELRSRGELAGHLEAESVELSGRVRAQTVMRARSLEVSSGEGASVSFGACELSVGDEPSKQQSIDEAIGVAAPAEPTLAPVSPQDPESSAVLASDGSSEPGAGERRRKRNTGAVRALPEAQVEKSPA